MHRSLLAVALAATMGLSGAQPALPLPLPLPMPMPVRSEAAGAATAVAGNAFGVTRYKIEAVGFHANDETWYDGPFFAWWISDEIAVFIRDHDRRVSTLSRQFSNVDAGDSRSFDADENCILPIGGHPSHTGLSATTDTWSCAPAGVPGPFSFTVEMYEIDGGFFHTLHDCLANAGCGFSIPAGNSYSGSHLDDLVGHRTLVFTAQELAAAMPRVNDVVEETIKLGPCFDERGCIESPGTPNDPEYTFTYRLTRLPNTLPDPLLDPDPD